MEAYAFMLKMKNYASSEIQKVSQELGVIDKNALKANGSINSINASSGSLKNTWSGLIGIASKIFVAVGAFESVKSLFNIGVQAEQSRVKFEVLLGSVGKAKKMLGELSNYADKTPYSFKGLQQGAETMLGFGVAENQILPNMRMIGDIAMGNEEKLSSLSLVYSQISATGKLMGQDLQQLITSGFNPLQIISDKTGLSIGVLKNKMEKGAISSEMVTEAFKIATSEGGRYYKMTEQMAETAGGKWSTMLDDFGKVTKTVGEKFAEWIKPLFNIGSILAGKIIPFGKWLINYQWIIYTVALAFTAYNAIMMIAAARTAFLAWKVSFSTTSIIFNTIATYGWSGAWTVLNATMKANPIGFIITLIALLVSGIIYAYKNFTWFRGAVTATWEVLKGFGIMIKKYVINRVQEMITGITGMGSALKAFFKGDFSEAMEIGKKAGANLLGFQSKAEAYKELKGLGEIGAKGYAEGIKQVATPKKSLIQNEAKKTGEKSTKSKIFDSLLNAGGEDGKLRKDKKETTAKNQKGDGIVSGGSKQTNIVINITRLIDKFDVNVTNIKEGGAQVKDIIQEELLRAVNSVNQMQLA